MRWFKHEADARNSLKLRKVRRKYGADGYAIYWFCLEAIAYDVDKDNLTFQLKEDAETIGFELSIQEKRVEEIMRYMVEIGLFESSRNTITCLKLAERLDKTMTNSPKMRKWLETKSVMTSDDSVMALGDIPRHSATPGELEVEENRIDNNTITPSGDVTPPPKKPTVDYSVLQMTDEQVEEVKRIRKQTKGVISQRAINQLAKECDLSRRRGFSNDDILNEWTTRGWRSYKDEWNRSKPSAKVKATPSQPTKNTSLDDEIRELMESGL